MIIHPSNTEAEKYDPLMYQNQNRPYTKWICYNLIIYFTVEKSTHSPPARLGMPVYIKIDNFNMFLLLFFKPTICYEQYAVNFTY
jgi:hypothetical protein